MLANNFTSGSQAWLKALKIFHISEKTGRMTALNRSARNGFSTKSPTAVMESSTRGRTIWWARNSISSAMNRTKTDVTIRATANTSLQTRLNNFSILKKQLIRANKLPYWKESEMNVILRFNYICWPIKHVGVTEHTFSITFLVKKKFLYILHILSGSKYSSAKSITMLLCVIIYVELAAVFLFCFWARGKKNKIN